MRRWLRRGGLATGALLAACGGDATSPSYSLDLAEIRIGVPSQTLVVPDSAFVGEPFLITTFAANRGCESPGGLSVTETTGRVRIVGAVKVASGGELTCPTPGAWSQSTTVTPTVDGSLTIVLIGRVRDRTDSVSRVVRVMPRRSLRGSLAGTATPRLTVPRSGAE